MAKLGLGGDYEWISAVQKKFIGGGLARYGQVVLASMPVVAITSFLFVSFFGHRHPGGRLPLMRALYVAQIPIQCSVLLSVLSPHKTSPLAFRPSHVIHCVGKRRHSSNVGTAKSDFLNITRFLRQSPIVIPSDVEAFSRQIWHFPNPAGHASRQLRRF